MNTLVSEPLATKVQFDSHTIWVELADGRKLGVPLAYFPRLLHATSRQRGRYMISGGGTGLHWEELDEDISVRALLLGIGDQTRQSSRHRRQITAIKSAPGGEPRKLKAGKHGQTNQ
jgi:hypothetical protein